MSQPDKHIPYIIDQKLLTQEESYIWDPSAERGLLACVMQKPELIVEAERLVRPEWFFYELHQYIYRMMIFVAQQAARCGWAVSFDEMTVMSAAKQAGPEFVDRFLKRIDGFCKWHEIADAAKYVGTDQFQRYVTTVKDRAARVALFRKARQLQIDVMNMESNPNAAMLACEYEGHLSRIAFGSTDDLDGKMQKLGDYSRGLLFKASLSNQYPHKSLFHIRHPRFHYWMHLMGGGFRRNSLTIVAARPKVGKTTLLLNVAMDLAMGDPERGIPGIPVVFLDTEMSGEEMISRELSNVAGIMEHALIAGKFLNDGASLQAVQNAVAKIDRAPFYYVSIAGKPIDYSLSVMRQFRNQHVGQETLEFQGRQLTFTQPCAVFYDWIKLPSMGDISHNVGEHQLLGDIATKLKDAARLLNLPIIAGAQNNRNAIGRDEQDHMENAEAHVAGSDRLIQFCNTLCILRNPSQAMQDAIVAQWGHTRSNADEPDEKGPNTWFFNQLLQVVVQRQGREFRWGIPMYLHRGQARYEEVVDPRFVARQTNEEPTIQFIKNFTRESRAKRKQAANPPSAPRPPVVIGAGVQPGTSSSAAPSSPAAPAPAASGALPADQPY